MAGGINLYAYCPNPLTSVDLDGLHSGQTGPSQPGNGKAGPTKEQLKTMSLAERRAHFLAKGVPPSQLGPSGFPKVHIVEKSTEKQARDAARQHGGTAPIKHTQDKGQPTHYHAVDEEGEKLKGKDNIHFQKKGAKSNPP
jgi:hypothetical protein